jgi:hypothetical protein
MAKDGRIDADEAREIGELVFDFVGQLLSRPRGAAPGG